MVKRMTRREKETALRTVLIRAQKAHQGLAFDSPEYMEVIAARIALGEHEIETKRLGNELPYPGKSEPVKKTYKVDLMTDFDRDIVDWFVPTYLCNNDCGYSYYMGAEGGEAFDTALGEMGITPQDEVFVWVSW